MSRVAESVADSTQPQARPAPWGRLFERYSPALKYNGFRVFSWLSGVLPLRFSYWIAALVGDFIYFTWHTHSANAVSNMRRVLGPRAGRRAIRRAARASFRNYAKTLVDFFRFPHVTAQEIDQRIVGKEGLSILDEARKPGKGAIAISGHLGNWDFAGAFIGRQGLPIYALADDFEPPQLDALVTETRRRNGLQVIKMDTGAMRTIFSALRRNEIVMLLIDRPMPGEGIPVEFFGETAWLPSGPAAIALKTGASLIIGYCVRLPGDVTFTGRIEPPLDYKSLLTGDKQTDMQAITQCIASGLEAMIRRTPEQWYMFRPMWPRPPTAREKRQAQRARLRRARRLRRTPRFQYARRSVARLRTRLRGPETAPAPDLAGMALGISVDPPELEEWVRQGPQE